MTSKFSIQLVALFLVPCLITAPVLSVDSNGRLNSPDKLEKICFTNQTLAASAWIARPIQWMKKAGSLVRKERDGRRRLRLIRPVDGVPFAIPAFSYESPIRPVQFIEDESQTSGGDQHPGSSFEQQSLETVLAQWPELKIRLEQGIGEYVQDQVEKGVFTPEKATVLLKKSVSQIKEWATSPAIDRYTRTGIVKAIHNRRWEDLVTAYSDQLKFGTAGPRSKAALTAEELVAFKEKGFAAEILKGPNTVNNVTIARLTTGVARHFTRVQIAKGSSKRAKVSITWDSRVHGRGLADLVAAIFLKEGLDVLHFDVSSPMPVMSFSVAEFKLDLGILISASHNPEAFNGYKVSDPAGAQLAPALRKAIEASIYGDSAQGIPPVTLEDIAWIVKASANLEDPTEVLGLPPMTMGPLTKTAWEERGRRGLTFLSDFDREATAHSPAVLDVHDRHRDHVMSLLLLPLDEVRKQLRRMFALYSAMYGNGEGAYNRLVVDENKGLGLPSHSLKEFARLDGLFPRFAQHKPKALLPDPGNSAGQAHAWAVVMKELRDEVGSDSQMKSVLQEIGRRNGVIFGTDPDADRLGVAVPIPENQLVNDSSVQEKQLVFYIVPPEWRGEVGFAALRLLPANDTWALVTKYRIDRLAEILTPEQKKNLHFSIIKTHVTTDQIKALQKYAEFQGLQHVEIIEPFVGFSLVADAIRDGWRRGVINLSGQEESGGFSIGGGPPVAYALLYAFHNHQDLGIAVKIDRLKMSHPEPLLAMESESYFGYSLQEIQEGLNFLKSKGVLTKAKKDEFRLDSSYSRLTADDYWKRVEPLIEEAPGMRLGKRGHTMEKDGLMALVLVAEVAAYANRQGMTLNYYLWEELYGKVGYYATTNQALEYPFTQAGTAQKISYLQNVLDKARQLAKGKPLIISGNKVVRVEIFLPKEPKYADPANFPVEKYRDLAPLLSDRDLQNNPSGLKSFFPEEGIRFYFTNSSHLTVRPSGTEPKLRFYVQWLATDIKGQMSNESRNRKADETAYDVAMAAKQDLAPGLLENSRFGGPDSDISLNEVETQIGKRARDRESDPVQILNEKPLHISINNRPGIRLWFYNRINDWNVSIITYNPKAHPSAQWETWSLSVNRYIMQNSGLTLFGYFERLMGTLGIKMLDSPETVLGLLKPPIPIDKLPRDPDSWWLRHLAAAA